MMMHSSRRVGVEYVESWLPQPPQQLSRFAIVPTGLIPASMRLLDVPLAFFCLRLVRR